MCIDSAVRRGSRKEAGKLVRGKSTFRILERRKSSVMRKNEGNKVERSNYRIKIQNFQLEKISVPIILIPIIFETEFTEFHEFKRNFPLLQESLGKKFGKNSNGPCLLCEQQLPPLFMINFYPKRHFIILITRESGIELKND